MLDIANFTSSSLLYVLNRKMTFAFGEPKVRKATCTADGPIGRYSVMNSRMKLWTVKNSEGSTGMSTTNAISIIWQSVKDDNQSV